MLKVREVKNYKTLVNVNVIRPVVSVSSQLLKLEFYPSTDWETRTLSFLRVAFQGMALRSLRKTCRSSRRYTYISKGRERIHNSQ